MSLSCDFNLFDFNLYDFFPSAICQYFGSCIMETDRTVSDRYSYSRHHYFPVRTESNIHLILSINVIIDLI